MDVSRSISGAVAVFFFCIYIATIPEMVKLPWGWALAMPLVIAANTFMCLHK